MKTYILASLILSAGCLNWQESPTRTYAVYVDPSFSDLQASDILLVVNEWEQLSGGFIKFHGTTDPNASDVIAFYPKTTSELNAEYPGDIGVQISEGQSSNIDLDMSLDEGRFLQTARHEVGHAIGIQTHIGQGNVMCKDTSCASLTIQCGDLVALCNQAWGCDASTMPGCQ